MNFWESLGLSRAGSKLIAVTTRDMYTVMNKQFGITKLWVSPICQGKGFSAFPSTTSTECIKRATSSNIAKLIMYLV